MMGGEVYTAPDPGVVFCMHNIITMVIWGIDGLTTTGEGVECEIGAGTVPYRGTDFVDVYGRFRESSSVISCGD